MATLSVKISGAAGPSVLSAVNRLWRGEGHFNPPDIVFFDQRVREAYHDVLLLGDVVAACAVLALSLACIGLFALAAFTTERRTKEFGVRKAMGAGAFDIARLLLWQFSLPVLAASAVAWPLGWIAMTWWLRGFADRVELSPWTFVAVTAVALVIAWTTVLAQTLRVARPNRSPPCATNEGTCLMFRNYLAAALRNLSRNRLYAGITIAGLAVGFAAAMLIALFVPRRVQLRQVDSWPRAGLPRLADDSPAAGRQEHRQRG